MVQGGMSFIKYLMVAFNTVFVICDIVAMIAVALIVYFNREFTVFMNSKYLTIPTILIAVGCIIFLLAFLGCCGAARENRCMVMTFGILLFLVFMIEIGASITAYINRNQIEDVIRQNMNSTIVQHKKDAMIVWDILQIKWHCCGVDGPRDWPDTIPASCCPQSAQNCTLDAAYALGCFQTVLDKVKDNIGKIGIVAIVIAFIELAGVVLSCCLASAIKKKNKDVYRKPF